MPDRRELLRREITVVTPPAHHTFEGEWQAPSSPAAGLVMEMKENTMAETGNIGQTTYTPSANIAYAVNH